MSFSETSKFLYVGYLSLMDAIKHLVVTEKASESFCCQYCPFDTVSMEEHTCTIYILEFADGFDKMTTNTVGINKGFVNDTFTALPGGLLNGFMRINQAWVQKVGLLQVLSTSSVSRSFLH